MAGDLFDASPVATIERKFHGQVTSIGWQLPDDMGEAEWRAAGAMLGAMERSVGWWIGDWWAFGERKYGKRKAATQNAEWNGPSYEVCKNYGAIAKKFRTSYRYDVLSFTHHIAVAALELDDALRLLDIAAREGWSVRELRREAVDCRNSARISLIGRQLSFGRDATRYAVVYADPPWQYDHPLSLTRRIENQYPTLTTEAICELPVAAEVLAGQAMLFLWVPPSLLRHGLQVIDAWDCEFLTSMIWDKGRPGMGYYIRQQHEYLLLAYHGAPIVPSPSDLPVSVITAPRFGHSQKPEVFRTIIENMYPGLPRIELFARPPAAIGWEVWGNEIAA